MMMRAVSVLKPGELKMQNVPMPEPGPKDVLCKVSYCGICGTDMAIWSGDLSFVKEGLIKYPCRIGHEWSGIVTAVGRDVKNFKPGDHIVSDNGVVCGECPACQTGNFVCCENSRAVGTVNCWDGAFADYMLMPARHVYKLPDHIGLDEAALIEPSIIAYNGLRLSGAAPGSTVVIIGTGPIGLAAVNIAKAMGAAKVILSGRRDAKLAIGKQMGADVCVNSTKTDFVKTVRDATGGKGADAVVETSGNVTVLNDAVDVLRPAGTLALIGFYETVLDGFNIDKVTLNMINIKGIAGSLNIVPHVIGLMANRQIDLRPLITNVYPFDDYMTAFNEVKANNDNRIKVLIKIGGDSI